MTRKPESLRRSPGFLSLRFRPFPSPPPSPDPFLVHLVVVIVLGVEGRRPPCGAGGAPVAVAPVRLQYGSSQGPGMRACPSGTFWVLGARLSTQHLCGPHSFPRGLVEPAGHLRFPEESSSSWLRPGLRKALGLLPRHGPLSRQQAPSQLGTCPDSAL